MPFRIITHLEQGTSRWREWRKSVIGASDAPKIMGEGFRSSENSDDLLKEKEERGCSFFMLF